MTNSVCRVMAHLTGRGHEVLVIAPGPGPGVPLPFYRSFVGLPSRQVTAELRDFRPDVIHLAAR